MIGSRRTNVEWSEIRFSGRWLLHWIYWQLCMHSLQTHVRCVCGIFLPTALSPEVMQLLLSLCMSVCFHYNFWTEWPLTLTFFLCMGHNDGYHGIEGEGYGHGLSLKRSQWDLSPQSRAVFQCVYASCVARSSCKEGDLVMFTWEECHGHYVACLTSDAPKHFLHHECLPQLNIPLSDGTYSLTFRSLLLHSRLFALTWM